MTRGLLISAPNSGAGKTTVTLGVIRALSDDGLIVQPFKSGPDYIDPAFHTAAAGRPSYNLDTWAMQDRLLIEIAKQSEGADIAIAEGSMGLFDSVSKKGASGYGSSAEISSYFGWPVILVIDVSGQAQSAAAVAAGFSNYRKDLPFAGVILNRVASPRHEKLIKEGMKSAGVRVLGSLPKRGDLTIPERHLGLIQATEHPDLEKSISTYSRFLREHVDLEALKGLAKFKDNKFPKLCSSMNLISPPAPSIAIASDEAFSFIYPHLLHYWKSSGIKISFFSPLADQSPDKSARLVWLPGGYPELHGAKIAAAKRCFHAIREHAKTKPVHGECGGYMVLGTELVDKAGKSHKMLGLLGLRTSFKKRKFHLGYRKAIATVKIPALPNIKHLMGHEFHYTSIIDQPNKKLFDVYDANGETVSETGSYDGNVSGTFFHMIAERK